MDLFAAELGSDPAEVRRRNLFASDAFPVTTASGAGYDSGDYERALDLALETAGYDALREEQKRRRESGDSRALGIGVSVYVEITNGLVEPELGDVEITPDGEAVLRTGSFSHGQGHETTFAMIVADRLGLPIESVRVIKGDTDEVSQGVGTYGSKSTQIGGVAARVAADVVVERARVLAAEQLEASADDVVLDAAAGGFHVVGSPTPVLSWKELAAAADAQGRLEELRAAEVFKADAPTFPFGAHVAVVEVDTETGAVELRRLVAVDDAGNIVNPVIAEGQVHGGVATGVAQALFEEFVYDEEGNPLRPVRRLRVPLGSRAAVVRRRRDGDADSAQCARREGHRRVGHDRVDARCAERGGRRARAVRRPACRMPANGERVWRALQDAHASN